MATILYGNEGGAGDGTSVAQAKDLQALMTDVNADAMDDDLHVYIITDVMISATLNLNNGSQDNSQRIVFFGKGSDGLGDEERTITAISTGYPVWTLTAGSYTQWRNIKSVGVADDNGWACSNSVHVSFYQCTADLCDVGWSGVSAGALWFYRCLAQNCVTEGFQSTTNVHDYVECVSKDNGRHGFLGGRFYYRCIAYNNGSIGFAAVGPIVDSCTSHNNGEDGITIGSTTPGTVMNTVSTSNGQYGIEFGASTYCELDRFATTDNTSGRINAGADATYYDNNDPGITTIPYINAVAGNFALNGAATGGLLLQNLTGISLTGDASNISYHDIGAAQKIGASTATDPFTGAVVNRGVN